MSGDRSAIHDAYRRTSFRAAADGARVEIRVGGRTPQLDSLLRARGVSDWAFVTAANPHATRLPDGENAGRHAELARAVAALGFTCFDGEGVGDDASWPAERSLLVIGISEADAIEVARRFEQEAIVVGSLGAPARLAFCGDRS